MSKSSIGLAMIMQNERAHIPPTLAQFYHVVDDIVVIDGGSTDDSVSWAERLGARVFHRPFNNNFSDQKNFAIENLETDWIYFHNPDERLEPLLLENLSMFTTPGGQKRLKDAGIIPQSGDVFDCFGIPRKNFIDGIQTPIYPNHQYHLFSKSCRFVGVVDEKLTNFTNDALINCPNSNAGFNILRYVSSTAVADQEQLCRDLREKELRGTTN